MEREKRPGHGSASSDVQCTAPACRHVESERGSDMLRASAERGGLACWAMGCMYGGMTGRTLEVGEGGGNPAAKFEADPFAPGRRRER
eukprot:666477-Rhodomonas_salina.1